MKYLVVYSHPVKQFDNPFWRVFAEKTDLTEAKMVAENISQHSRDYTITAYPFYCEIGMVAVFSDRGAETFLRKPRLLIDNRDKSDWIITGCGEIINSANSDYSLNINR